MGEYFRVKMRYPNYAQKSFILFRGFKKMKYFQLFPILKIAVNYSEIGRVGKLEAGFQQVPVVQLFWKFHNIGVCSGSTLFVTYPAYFRNMK